MVSRRLIGSIIAIAAIAVAVFSFVSSRRPAPATSHSAAAPEPPRNPAAPRAAPAAASAAAVDFAGFPAGIARDPARRYEFARDCAKFRHFDALYREKSADPAWPLSSPEALAAAEPERRSRLQETARFLDRHRPSCNAWLQATPQDLQNAQIYEAALHAARRGDRGAAACFVLASWQIPNPRSPYHAGWAEAYATHARRFMLEGLNTGSWPIVLAASMAVRNDSGLASRAGFSARDDYLLSRLAQRGASNASDRSQYDLQAQTAARGLGASELAAMDERVARLFENQFKRASASAQAVTDACVN